MRIGFDLDGVGCDLIKTIRDKILEKTNHDIYTSQNSYRIECPGMNQKEISKLIRDVINKDKDMIQPYPNFAESLKMFHEITGEPIYIITSRSNSTKRKTNEWLDEHLEVGGEKIPFKTFFVPAHKKSEFLEKNKFSFFVEDHVDTANSCESQNIVFLVNRYWNEAYETKSHVIRVESLEDALEDYSFLINLGNKFLF